MSGPDRPDPAAGGEVLVELRGAEKVFVQRRRAGRLRRHRREVRAVDGVDLVVRRGEVVGYLGPNGAGKSTTVKMLTGILVPSGGTVRVAGLDPSRHRVDLARRVGVVFGQRSQLWPDLPLVDSFELLYLDEPTIGLDVVAKERVRTFLAHLNAERGVTVLLTTHDLVDVERLCRRVVVIDHGRVVHDGDLGTLVRAAGATRTVVVTLAEPRPPLAVEGVASVEVDGVRQRLRLRSAGTSAAAVVAAVMAQAEVDDVAVEEPAIDEVITAVYARGAGLVRPAPPD